MLKWVGIQGTYQDSLCKLVCTSTTDTMSAGCANSHSGKHKQKGQEALGSLHFSHSQCGRVWAWETEVCGQQSLLEGMPRT